MRNSFLLKSIIGLLLVFVVLAISFYPFFIPKIEKQLDFTEGVHEKEVNIWISCSYSVGVQFSPKEQYLVKPAIGNSAATHITNRVFLKPKISKEFVGFQIKDHFLPATVNIAVYDGDDKKIKEYSMKGFEYDMMEGGVWELRLIASVDWLKFGRYKFIITIDDLSERLHQFETHFVVYKRTHSMC